MVVAARVALPDLYFRAGERPPVGIQHPAEEVEDFAGSLLGATGDLHQVVVGIERQIDRVKRPGGLARRRCEFRQGLAPARYDGEPRHAGHSSGLDNGPAGEPCDHVPSPPLG
jgi:hypothetical protein